MPHMYRQGDVLFVKIEVLPSGLTERQSNILVEGEVTGHAHRLEKGRILEDALGSLYVSVLLAATQVVHEEHGAITLEPGYYQVIRQREYNPEAIRLVMD